MAGTLLYRSPVPAHHLLYVSKGRNTGESPALLGTAHLAADRLGHGGDAGLKAMQRNNQIAIIKEFTVMPNHIHLFIFYKKFHPRLPEWFIEKTREFLLYYIEPPRDRPVPVWEESVDTQMVYTDTAQYAVAESLKEYAHHWKYDPLHKR